MLVGDGASIYYRIESMGDKMSKWDKGLDVDLL